MTEPCSLPNALQTLVSTSPPASRFPEMDFAFLLGGRDRGVELCRPFGTMGIRETGRLPMACALGY
jgi:hypothetical protein